MAKNKTIDWEEEIKKTTSQFLEKLRIVASISIIREKAEGDSKEDVYKVNIETEDRKSVV